MRISDWSSDVCSSDLHQRRQHELPPRRVQSVDLPQDVLEMMLPGMRQVQQLLLVRAPGARGEGVQHRLPDVGRAAIDQDNACLAATTQRVPKTGCQDKSDRKSTRLNSSP